MVNKKAAVVNGMKRPCVWYFSRRGRDLVDVGVTIYHYNIRRNEPGQHAAVYLGDASMPVSVAHHVILDLHRTELMLPRGGVEDRIATQESPFTAEVPVWRGKRIFETPLLYPRRFGGFFIC
jgi:hypothetical protein